MYICTCNLYLCVLFFVFGPYPVGPKTYSWLCIQSVLLADSGHHMGYWGSRLGQTCAGQVPYQMYYFSGLCLYILKAVLLRCNLSIIYFTDLKCLLFFQCNHKVCSHHQNNFAMFLIPQEKPCSHQQTLLPLLHSLHSSSTWFYFLSLDLLILDSSCK